MVLQNTRFALQHLSTASNETLQLWTFALAAFEVPPIVPLVYLPFGTIGCKWYHRPANSTIGNQGILSARSASSGTNGTVGKTNGANGTIGSANEAIGTIWRIDSAVAILIFSRWLFCPRSTVSADFATNSNTT